MSRRPSELLLSVVAIAFITVAYLLVSFIYRQNPDPAGLFGHALGILGFILMVMAETLYPLRKQIHNARWGSMAAWLEFHVFTGLVGPYMVLLHSAWSFKGLAGVLTLMTGIIVISGFVGRYFYTSIPRDPDGIELPQTDQARLAGKRRLLAIWHVIHIPLGLALFALAIVHIIAAVYYASLMK